VFKNGFTFAKILTDLENFFLDFLYDSQRKESCQKLHLNTSQKF